MLRVLPPTFKPVMQQIRLLQKGESSPAFLIKICTCWRVLQAQGELVLQQVT